MKSVYNTCINNTWFCCKIKNDIKFTSAHSSVYKDSKLHRNHEDLCLHFVTEYCNIWYLLQCLITPSGGGKQNESKYSHMALPGALSFSPGLPPLPSAPPLNKATHRVLLPSKKCCRFIMRDSTLFCFLGKAMWMTKLLLPTPAMHRSS